MSMTFGCRDAVRRLWEYLDGTLPPEDLEALEAHLQFCLQCCGELEFSRELRRTLRDHTASPVPDQVEQRLHDFIDRLGGRQPGPIEGTEGDLT